MRLEDKGELELVGLEIRSARTTSPTRVSVKPGRKGEWATRKLGSNKERKSLKERSGKERGRGPTREDETWEQSMGAKRTLAQCSSAAVQQQSHSFGTRLAARCTGTGGVPLTGSQGSVRSTGQSKLESKTGGSLPRWEEGEAQRQARGQRGLDFFLRRNDGT